MKFTKKDKEYILHLYGGIQKTVDEDIGQIEAAADVTEYYVMDKSHDDNKRKISRLGAIRLLGREGWISGLVRSAFHWTAMRETKDGNRYVSFDSRKLFR